MAITGSVAKSVRQARTEVGGHADRATRDLAAMWVAAWLALSRDLDAAIGEAVALAAKLERWPAAYELNRIDAVYQVMTAAQQALVDLAGAAGTTIATAVAAVVQATGVAEPGLIAAQLPADRGPAALATIESRIKPSMLDLIAARAAAQIALAMQKLTDAPITAMHREVIRGVAAGTPHKQAVQHITGRIHDAFNSALASAVTIARTEILDAYRAAAQYVQQANADLVESWVWICFLTPNTCAACIGMDGSIHPLSESGPDGHPNCRCARVPLLYPWSDLGITDEEPASALPDARAWFAAQPESVQKQILGPGRLALLQSGAISWNDIPRVRDNINWRPSYEPASLRDLQAEAAASA